jgi:hypothetical protein
VSAHSTGVVLTTFGPDAGLVSSITAYRFPVAMNIPTSDAISYLHSIMGHNKAKGLVAQIEFRKWVRSNLGTAAQKHFEGCWILPARELPYSRRVCFFVDQSVRSDNETDERVRQLLGDKGFHGLCSSLRATGLGVAYYIASSDSKPSIERLRWHGYFYSNDQLIPLDEMKTYREWGTGGHASKARTKWESPTEKRYSELSPEELTDILLPQLFYNKVLKDKFKIVTPDPYDCDGFIVSYDGKVFPLEIKEKSPIEGTTQKYGIDAGRLLMLLRVCLPLDANAFYIIRELESGGTRKFSKWKFISLDNVIMKSSWNLMPGGTGMGGGGTSTIILPYDAFGDLSTDTFSDDALRGLSPLTGKVKEQAASFAREIEGRLYRQSAAQGRI